MFLVDGFVAGALRLQRARRVATLTIEPFQPLHPSDREAVAGEGERLLRFLADDTPASQLRFL